MLIKNLQELKRRVENGEVEVSEGVKSWGGADVIIDRPDKHRMKNHLDWLYEGQIPADILNLCETIERESGSQQAIYFKHHEKHLLLTPQAAELTQIMLALKKLFAPVIDYANKYEFYGSLVQAASEATTLSDSGVAMVDEALRMAKEIMDAATTYFAYGNNMSASKMNERCPGAQQISVAQLPQHRWLINERGYSTVTASAGSHVYGVLWDINAEHEAALDGYEGVESGAYYKDVVFVEVVGEPLERPLPAKIYWDERIIPGVPQPDYLENILNAANANGFPESYVAYLESWKVGNPA